MVVATIQPQEAHLSMEIPKKVEPTFQWSRSFILWDTWEEMGILLLFIRPNFTPIWIASVFTFITCFYMILFFYFYRLFYIWSIIQRTSTCMKIWPIENPQVSVYFYLIGGPSWWSIGECRFLIGKACNIFQEVSRFKSIYIKSHSFHDIFLNFTSIEIHPTIRLCTWLITGLRHLITNT